MGFSKKGNIYTVTRMTGNRDNILGICFGNTNTNENDIEIIEWDFPNTDHSIIKTPKEEVLKQVMFGLNSINKTLGTNYRLSKIYYVPHEDESDLIYQSFIMRLIAHYHEGNKFKEF